MSLRNQSFRVDYRQIAARSLGHILQLAYIAGKWQTAEPVERFRRNFGSLATTLLGNICYEMLGESGDIFSPLSQSGEAESDEIDAIEEIFAERALGHHRREVGISGADGADIRASRVAVAKSLEGMVLQYAQHFDLRGLVEVAYLIEEECAVVGKCHTPRAVGDSSCEGPLDMTKHLAFEERSRDATEIDLDEALPSASAIGMDGIGDHLLARTVFSEY